MLTLSVGCSTSAPEVAQGNGESASPRTLQAVASTADTTDDAAASAAATASPAGAAFVHRLSASRFSVGSGHTQIDAGIMHKFVGDQGVFATFPSGMILATSNASAQVRQHGGPLPGGSAAHNQAVRDYFVGAGLPANQIQSVDIFPVVGSLASTNSSGPTPDPTLLYYNSFIRRQIAGISVADSYAWARINQDGVVINESVYWPNISDSAIAQAKSFAALLADDASAAAYSAKLPSKKRGKLVIHHTPGEWPGIFAAAAVYDVPDDNIDFVGIIHFDANGVQAVLPHEAKGAWGPTPVSLPRVR